MGRFVVRRALFLVPMLLLVSMVSFGLLEAAPGDPALRVALSQSQGQAQSTVVAQIRENLGLDEPLPQRYGEWLAGVFSGDFGLSYTTGEPASGVVFGALWPTLLLTGTALVLSILLSLVLGVLAGLRPGGLIERAVDSVVLLSFAIPTFVVALLVIQLFAVTWDFFPAGGISDPGAARTPAQVATHLILPAAALAVGALAGFTRIIAASVREASDGESARNARALGVRERTVVFRHVLRLSLIPLVSAIGASLSWLIGGAYLAEVVFGWPGLGRQAVESAHDQDYAVLMAIVFLTGLLVVLGNLLADLLLGVLDPRVRRGVAPTSR